MMLVQIIFAIWFTMGLASAATLLMIKRAGGVIGPDYSLACLIAIFLPFLGFSSIAIGLTSLRKTDPSSKEDMLIYSIYLEYVGLCRSLEIEPLTRQQCWPQHREIAMKLKSAHDKISAQHTSFSI